MIFTEDFSDIVIGIAAFAQPFRDFDKFAGILEQIPTAIKIRTDADVVDACDVDGVGDMVKQLCQRAAFSAIRLS